MPVQSRAQLLAALGAAVRRQRLAAGYSQERLAEEAGLHPRYISDVERGRRNLGFVNLVALAGALGITPADLVKGVPGSAVESTRK